jgi:hypothetical protein
VIEGRRDRQVKVRGYRVELEEIEHVLEAHPQADQAAVLAQAENAQQLLVAFIVPAKETAAGGNQTLTPETLRQHLSAKLPDYLAPSGFVFQETMPMTPNGKIDHQALVKDGFARLAAPDRQLIPAENDLERLVVDLWLEALQLERVGVTDNFFDVGGNSLLMVQIHGRLKEKIQRDLEVLELFRNPTIRAMAAYLGQEEAAPASVQPVQDRAALQREAFMQQQRKNQNQERE